MENFDMTSAHHVQKEGDIRNEAQSNATRKGVILNGVQLGEFDPGGKERRFVGFHLDSF